MKRALQNYISTLAAKIQVQSQTNIRKAQDGTMDQSQHKRSDKEEVHRDGLG